ncbi:MAG: geranylgeranylglyceryl/heptaprenylglyceryl phosphate synthase [Candidatus Aenigmarchaeota archaeon]|nr:geranylgeranylglyceryl/heptaprenylglyceryl phosphate synthase [Candidatus Aenigmarchaeota archaeon]MDI6722894.1 geranylgeranylglyceryl/heptaprenylglyceryl phosphate synthase [Candidatus Aenigmarchaeota archaeon]
MQNVKDYILKGAKKGKMHFSLIDPDPMKVSTETIGELARELERYGSSAIMVGGSTNVRQKFLDDLVKGIKSGTSLPVILFPGGVNGISRYADAIFFMSLMNSTDPWWITGVQAEGAVAVRESGIEPISMGYLIIEPGMKAGQVGKADLIPRTDGVRAAEYALAAQYLGISFVYLEAGSGADKPVPPEMISKVKKSIGIPLIAGGGIRTPQAADAALSAGADIIVTGTIIEDDTKKVRDIIDVVKKFKR